jgi:hypothetical protein
MHPSAEYDGRQWPQIGCAPVGDPIGTRLQPPFYLLSATAPIRTSTIITNRFQMWHLPEPQAAVRKDWPLRGRFRGIPYGTDRGGQPPSIDEGAKSPDASQLTRSRQEGSIRIGGKNRRMRFRASAEAQRLRGGRRSRFGAGAPLPISRIQVEPISAVSLSNDRSYSRSGEGKAVPPDLSSWTRCHSQWHRRTDDPQR